MTKRDADAFIRAQLPPPVNPPKQHLTQRQKAELFAERRAAFVAKRNAELLKQRRPAALSARFCSCCEQDRPSDWIDARERYECDTCQRDA